MLASEGMATRRSVGPVDFVYVLFFRAFPRCEQESSWSQSSRSLSSELMKMIWYAGAENTIQSQIVWRSDLLLDGGTTWSRRTSHLESSKNLPIGTFVPRNF